MSSQDDGIRRADELKRALVAIRELRRRVAELEAEARAPIAIIGMACRFPGGADTPDRFWELLTRGVDATREVPKDRWDIDDYYDPNPDAPGKMYTRRGGFLNEPIDEFDAIHFGISPREAEALDPAHRLLLEVSWEALERAGIAPLSLRGTDGGVFLGISGSDYNTLQIQMPDLMSMYSGTGSAPSIAAGRISHFLGLHGPNVAVDTACSSSLVAIVQAVEALRAGKCSLALAGGAQVMLAPDSTVYLCKLRALSPSGRCKTFDASADGYARGEGAGIIVLKRLSDAVRDGDPIIAVIRGVAYNHDGHSSGLTVPNPAAQRMVIQAALKDAGLRPEDIQFVEAHGTATALGDPIEVRALTEALAATRSLNDPLLIGSAKANLGHLEAAAGVAGVIKLALSIAYGEIPPHINCETETPHIDWKRSPVRVVRERSAWPKPDIRIGGASAFGLSGTNAHVILQSAPADMRPAAPERPAELIVLSGRTRDAVRQLAARYRDYVQDANAPVSDVSYTSLVGRSPLAYRTYAVARDRAEMVQALGAIASARDDGLQPTPPSSGGIGFLFTGQGAQYPGMGSELYDHCTITRQVLEQCDEILRPHMDRSLIDLVVRERDAEVLRQTQYAQPALFAVEYALSTLWREWGIKPTGVAGHSLGEYVAATVAGVMSLEDALPLVALRGRLMQELPTGGRMAAVLAPAEYVAPIVATNPEVAIAAVNSAENTVISGPSAAVAAVLLRLREQGVEARDLHVSHAFHSALMEPMLDRFEQAVRQISLDTPRILLISNVTGEPMTPAEATDPIRWRRHVREPVQFEASLRSLYAQGISTFIEVGPHPSLSAMGMSTLTDPGVKWLPSMRRGRSGWRQILETAGELWRDGHPLDTAALAREHGGRRVAIPTVAFQRSSYWFTTDRTQRRTVVHNTHSTNSRAGDWIHSIGWENVTSAVPLEVRSGDWLVVDNGDAVVAQIGAALDRRGLPWSCIPQSLLPDLNDLPAGTAGVIYPGWPKQPPSGAADIADAMADTGNDVIRLVQLLARRGTALRAITRGAGGFDPPDGAWWQVGASLWGAISVVAAECPELRPRVVDSTATSSEDYDQLIAWVIGETDEDRIVLRDGCALAPRITAGLPAAQAWQRYHSVTAGLRNDAAYLVTGASGGVGRSVVEWLVKQGVGALVLNSRSAPTAATEEWLDRLRSAGTTIVWNAGDVAVSSDVQGMVEAVATTGLPLRGVFHVAGVLDDGLLSTYDRNRYRRVLAPKVDGALNLHAATQGIALDHFVVFSSAAAVFGGPGQAAYAAANAFLGSLVQYRRGLGLSGLCIDWGAWAGDGMAGRLSDREVKLLESRGLLLLHHEDALEALASLLSNDAERAIVFRVNWERVRASADGAVAPLLRRMLGESIETGQDQSGRVDGLRQMLAHLPPEQRRQRLTDYVVQTVSAALRLPAGELSPTTPLAGVGLDSLVCMELRNQIEADAGVLLPTATLLQAETPSAIVAAIEDSIANVSAPAVGSHASGEAWIEGEI